MVRKGRSQTAENEREKALAVLSVEGWIRRAPTGDKGFREVLYVGPENLFRSRHSSHSQAFQ